MNPVDFCQKKISEWEAAAKQAAENGDYEVWQHAQNEAANYREMLKRYAV